MCGKRGTTVWAIEIRFAPAYASLAKPVASSSQLQERSNLMTLYGQSSELLCVGAYLRTIWSNARDNGCRTELKTQDKSVPGDAAFAEDVP